MSERNSGLAMYRMLPTGDAWPSENEDTTLRKLIFGMAASTDDFLSTMQDVMDQYYPGQSGLFISDWETLLGLPKCGQSNQNVQTRVNQILAMLRISPYSTTEWFEEIAAVFGFDISVYAYPANHVITVTGIGDERDTYYNYVDQHNGKRRWGRDIATGGWLRTFDAASTTVGEFMYALATIAYDLMDGLNTSIWAVAPTAIPVRTFNPNTDSMATAFDVLGTMLMDITDDVVAMPAYTITEPAGGWVRTFYPDVDDIGTALDFMATILYDYGTGSLGTYVTVEAQQIYIYFNGTDKWIMEDTNVTAPELWEVASVATDPPKTGWSVGTIDATPAPTLDYIADMEEPFKILVVTNAVETIEFRAGWSSAGDPLEEEQTSTVLQCIMNFVKPAHAYMEYIEAYIGEEIGYV